MLSNDSSKIKYPSFRIDDILNNDYGSNGGEDLDTAIDYEVNSKLNNSLHDQPINLSSIKYTKDEHFKTANSFSLSNYTNLNETRHQFKKSSVSSSSPTLSVGSTDSPSFNHFSPTSPKSSIDQLIKCNLNDSKTNLFNPPVDESNHYALFCNNNVDLTNSFIQNQTLQYSPSSIEDFYLKLNQNSSAFDSISFDKNADSDDVSFHLTESLKKFQQEYQNQQLAKNALLNQFQSYSSEQQKNQTQATSLSPTTTENTFNSSLIQPNSSFYVQQLYIRMKMLMQAKPRKGGQIRFNHQQTNELEAMFSMKKYLIPSERKQIAKSLSLTERQVKTWFQNRRAKSRRSGNYRD